MHKINARKTRYLLCKKKQKLCNKKALLPKILRPKLMLFLCLAFVVSCAKKNQTSVEIVDSTCQDFNVITFSMTDTEQTLKEILIHNEKWEDKCNVATKTII